MDEKEDILCIYSEITDIINNKLIYNFEYKPCLKVYSIGNVMNFCTITDASYFEDTFGNNITYHRPCCIIDIDTGEMSFTDIKQTAKYILQLADKFSVISCDFHWKSEQSCHLTTCFMDFFNKNYNYFDINGYFNFGLNKKRNNKISFVKPMLVWTKAIIDEIYLITDNKIKLKPSKFSYYRRYNKSYIIRTDLPYIHDCPKGLEEGVCTFYCKWMDILLNSKDTNNNRLYDFEGARLYISSLTSEERKKNIKQIFDKSWNIYKEIVYK